MPISGPFVHYVAPSIGSVLGVIMLLSPIKAVWQIRRTQELGVSQLSGSHLCWPGATLLPRLQLAVTPCKFCKQCRSSLSVPQDINPLPYPMTAINCLGWIIYGAVIADPFIAPANIVGLVAGVLFTMTTLPYCSRKVRPRGSGFTAGRPISRIEIWVPDPVCCISDHAKSKVICTGAI